MPPIVGQIVICGDVSGTPISETRFPTIVPALSQKLSVVCHREGVTFVSCSVGEMGLQLRE